MTKKLVLSLIVLISIAGCANHIETRIIADHRAPQNKQNQIINISKSTPEKKKSRQYKKLETSIKNNLKQNGFIISDKEARLTAIISYSINKIKKPPYLKSLQTHDEEGNQHIKIFKNKKLYFKKSLILKVFKTNNLNDQGSTSIYEVISHLKGH